MDPAKSQDPEKYPETEDAPQIPPPVFVKRKSPGIVTPRPSQENQWPLIVILLILAIASIWFLTTRVSFSSVPVEEPEQESYRQTPRPQPGSG
jgi:hypothetical protein